MSFNSATGVKAPVSFSGVDWGKGLKARPIRRIMLVKPGVHYPRRAYGNPLGLLILVSILRRDFPGEFEIDLVDQALYRLGPKQMAERIRRFNPDLIGFSCLSVDAAPMHVLTRAAKEINPEIVTVLGGPHATMFWDLALQDPYLDLVVLHEGDVTFPELLKALRDGIDPAGVEGLAFRRYGEIVKTPDRELIQDMDSIPFPAWDLVDFDRYGREMSMNGNCYYQRWAMVNTSRGCPYHCIYCHMIFGKKQRCRSAENVLEHIELLVRGYGVKELHIVDDIFNLDLPRAKMICQQILERDLKVKIAFPNGLRGDRMDRELIHLLKLAGCYAITYGVETATPRLQTITRKNLNLEKVREAIAWTYETGIVPQGFFMLGFPGETPAEMKDTVNWAIRSKLLRSWFFTVIVYPRTPLFDMALEAYPHLDFSISDLVAQRPWAENDLYTKATGTNLARIVRDANRSFYLRPRVILDLIWRLLKNLFLFRGIYWGLRAVLSSLAQIEKNVYRAS